MSPVRSPMRDGIGASVGRPDGTLKVRGEFAYSSDLWADGMLWGTTLRSPHPRARIAALEIAPALALPGVHGVVHVHERLEHLVVDPDQLGGASRRLGVVRRDDRDRLALICLLYTSPSPRDLSTSRMPSSA